MSIANLFEGRIRPGYYFGGVVFMQVVVWLISLALEAMPGNSSLITVLIMVLSVAYFAVTLGPVVRRLHDLNKPGWYALLLLVPLVNLVFALWILFSSGDREANTYGPAPTHKRFFHALFNQA